MHIKPQKGQIVSGPDGQLLPAIGALVKPSTYWVRRLRDGDVELIKPRSKSKIKANDQTETTEDN